MGVTQCGWQVHPDQTKAVKRQDRKTLATQALKRGPCRALRRGIKKKVYFRKGKEKKNRARRKEKKIRKKTEKNIKETKKEKKRVSSMGMHQ